jgi:atypical dual specificity phosphatase
VCADLPLRSPRAYLVHFLYDPPALAVCYFYSAIMHDPINSLFTHITPNLLLGSLPFPHDVPTLHAAGVTAVVNMCREYPGPVGQYAAVGIEQCWLPTVDMGAPRLEDLERAVAFISQHLQSGGGSKVLIHCKCGMSRSASVVVSYLVFAERMTSTTALQLVKQKRPEVSTDILEYPAVKKFITVHLHPAVPKTEEKREKEVERTKEEDSGLGEIARTIQQRIVP